MPGPDLDRRRLLALGGAALAGLAAPRRGLALDQDAATLLADLHSRRPDGAHRTFSLRNATVVTHTGEVLQSAGVAVRDGVVVEVGSGVTAGIDLGGAWVVPGFTDAGCKVGMVEIGAESATADHSEDKGAVVPDARAIDAYNPLSEVVAVTRAWGVTTALLHPEPNRLVAGKAALVHTAGLTRDDALVASPVALVVGLGGAGKGGDGPSSRMGVAQRLREILDAVELPDEAEDEGKRKRRKKKGDGGPPKDDDLDPAALTWRQVRRGELPVLFKAERADDIRFAVELAEEWGIRAVILGGAEAWMAADQLAAAGVPALVGPLTVQPSSFEHPHARYDNAGLLHAAGVPLGFRTGSAHFSRGLSTSAGVAVAHGLPWAAAIQALTAGPAEILGIDGVGRLEPGAPATFFLTAGDPLQPRHAVQRVWVRGEEQRMDHRQRRLFERFRELW